MSTPNAATKPLAAIVPKPWQTGLAPHYIGLFLWIVYFDQVGVRALPVGGLMWSVLGAAVAGPLCFLLLFQVPATWGQANRKTLPELAASTFGERGAPWVPGLLLGLAEIVWFSVAVSYATDLTLRGLAEVRFLDDRAFRPLTAGALRIKGSIFLATSLLWSLIAGLVGRKFVRLVAAIMYVFPVFPAMLLGGAMLAMLGGLRTFAPSGIDPQGLNIPEARAGVWSMMLVVQLILGFFATAGAMGAEWGSATTSARDVRVGGWVAVGLAPVVIATIALLAVAGFQGRANRAAVAVEDFSGPLDVRTSRLRSSTSEIRTIAEPPPATFRAVLTDGIGGRVGCGMLMIFGAMALAPAVFSAYVFGQRLNETLPRLSRFRWTLVGITLSWPMTAVGLFDQLEPVFTTMGALFAPVVACLAAEFVRHKGAWPGPRRGVNLAGVVGWTAGLAVGLLPFAGGRLQTFQPATFWAFVVAFVVYWLVALVGGESAPISKLGLSDDHGFGPIESSTLPTVPTTSSSTDSLQGEGNP
jgi:cytosine permease